MYLPIGKKYNHYSAIKLPKSQSRSKFQWHLTDKIAQYKRIEEIIHQKYNLERTKCDAKRDVKNQQLNELQQKVKETKLKLNKLKDDEVHTIKNLLKGYKSSIRLEKPLNELLDHCDCKLFNKRKQLDRLNYEVNRLSNTLAAKQKNLQKIQSRLKCSESYNLAKRLKYHACLLDKSEIQIRNYENLLADLKRIIKYLSNESLHYANTLKILENELNEQNTVSDLLKQVRIPSANRAKIDKKRSQLKREHVLDEPNKRQTLTNECHNLDQYDAKTIFENTDNVTTNLCSATKCSNTSTHLHLNAKRIQSKLIASEKSVNILGNQFNEMHGKSEISNPTMNAPQSSQGKREVHQAAEQKSSTVERISGKLAKIRGAIQHFDDLLCKASEKKNIVKTTAENVKSIINL